MTVEDLCALMVKYGLTHLKHGDIELHRPESAVFAALIDADVKKDQPAEEEPDELTKIKAMDPVAQDAALTLAPIK